MNKKYKQYLIKKGYANNTIEKILAYTKSYTSWLDANNITEEKYSDLLSYIEYLQKNGKNKRLINEHLTYLSNYYNYKGFIIIRMLRQAVEIRALLPQLTALVLTALF